jgi:hypothetical protein
VSGSALRTMLKGAFDEMSAAVEASLPYLQTFFEGAILLSLKLYNALYPVRKAIKGLFGGDQTEGVASFEDTILSFAENVGNGFRVAALAIAWMIDNSKALATMLEGLIRITPGIGVAFETARSAINLLTSDLGAKRSTTERAGKNVADGVAAGITQGTPAVEAAMAAMGQKGVNAFDAKLQIHSPSRVMQLRGQFVDQGLAKGVNDNSEAPEKAMSDAGAGIAAAPLSPRAATGGKGASGGGALQITLNIHERAIVVSGSNAQEIAASLKDPLTELFADVIEKAAAMTGALEIKGAA